MAHKAEVHQRSPGAYLVEVPRASGGYGRR
jgi:hypothetical protein